jgi:hypothetical protein
MTDTRIWKHLKAYDAKVKHLFESEEAVQPLCRNKTTKNLTKWVQIPERLDKLRPCIKCVNKEHAMTRPPKQVTPPNPTPKKPFDEKNYTWKYIDSFHATMIHAFGKEATIPFCGRAPEEYGAFWKDDPEQMKTKAKCKLCVRYAH